MKNISSVIALCLMIWSANVFAQSNRIVHKGQELFLSGANVAWRNFANDVGPGETDFIYFQDMFAEVGRAGGNCMRWWLHTNGANNPEFDENGMCTGLEESHIDDMQRILDMAMGEGIMIDICLWSFDMLRKSFGTTVTDRNKKLLQDTTFTRAYINNALIPMVEALKDHPAIVCWEIFNEPEGMSNEFGWDFTYHVPMRDIQRFINLCAGAIHRIDPDAKVTNGSWSFNTQTDKLGKKNYYTDARLIAAGGDSAGYLDFYQVHYYTWAGTELSPFHHPASYWDLDKPLVVGEFYADSDIFGVPKAYLYNNLYNTGYAGALAWQYNEADKRPDMLANMQYLVDHYPDDIIWKVDNYKPKIVNAIPDTIVDKNSEDLIAYVNLKNVFFDPEDSTNLTFSVENNSNPDLVTPVIHESGQLDLLLAPDTCGKADIRIKAEDSGGFYTTDEFRVSVRDPNAANLALLRPVTVSSTEEGLGNIPAKAVDGDMTTRWSSVYSDSQWIYVDLENTYEFNQVVLYWEVAYGKSYEIQVSDDAENWTTVFSESNGDGRKDEINFDTITRRYVRMYGIDRGTGWGFSLWEFEVYNANNTGIDEEHLFVPCKFSLEQNYPNPFNSMTIIRFTLPKSSNVTLKIYSILGKEIETLLTGYLPTGSHEIEWIPQNLTSGVYFYRLEAGQFSETKKLIFLK